MEEGSLGGKGSYRAYETVVLRIRDIPIDLDLNKAKKPMVRKPWQCMPKAALIPSMQVKSSKI